MYVGANVTESMVDLMLDNRHTARGVFENVRAVCSRDFWSVLSLFLQYAHRLSHERLPKEFTTAKEYYRRDWHGLHEYDDYAHKQFMALNVTSPEITPLFGTLSW